MIKNKTYNKGGNNKNMLYCHLKYDKAKVK